MRLLLLLSITMATLLGAVKAWTDAQRKEFVDAHNEFRRKANPPAAAMNRVVWSSRIEKFVEETPKTMGCKFDHTKGDILGKRKLGENLFSGGGGPKDIVKSWHSEVVNYTYATGKCSGKDCGHYTQVMRGGLSEIGCAECTGSSGRMVWCQYDYQNLPEPIYEQGEQCLKCATAKIKCDEAVCGKSPVVHCVDGLCDVKGDRPILIGGGTGSSAAVTPTKAGTPLSTLVLAVTVAVTLLGPLCSLVD